MKIANSQLQLAGQHQSDVQHSIHSQLSMQAEVRPTHVSDTQVSLSAEAFAAQQLDKSGLDLRNQLAHHPLWHLVQELVRKITGRDLNINDVVAAGASQSATPPSPAPTKDAANDPATTTQISWRIESSQVEVYQETEQASFHASGTVTTADGRSIDFSAALDLYRSYTQVSAQHIDANNQPPQKDPLVLNFGRGSVALGQDKVNFDIDGDGTIDHISFPTSGSGFLALDRNGNGKIDDGTELFGAQTGNGFGDLAQLDADKNGWIDENDAAWAQLKLWVKDEQGKDKLLSLSDLGIGAISLANTATDFALKDDGNTALGQLRRTGVYLKEDGTAGTIQQVDLSA